MTRKQEDKEVVKSIEKHQRAIRRMQTPRRFPITTRPPNPNVALDRISFEQRLKYGFELLNSGEGE